MKPRTGLEFSKNPQAIDWESKTMQGALSSNLYSRLSKKYAEEDGITRVTIEELQEVYWQAPKQVWIKAIKKVAEDQSERLEIKFKNYNREVEVTYKGEGL